MVGLRTAVVMLCVLLQFIHCLGCESHQHVSYCAINAHRIKGAQGSGFIYILLHEHNDVFLFVLIQ